MRQQIFLNTSLKFKVILATIIMAVVGSFCVQNTFADMMGCNSYGGYCDCASPNNCGAAWLNNDPGENGNNGIWADSNASEITAYLHGAVRNKGSSFGYENTSTHNYIITDYTNVDWDSGGQEIVEEIQAPFVTWGQGQDVYRGFIERDDWSSNWWERGAAAIVLDLNRFKEGIIPNNIDTNGDGINDRSIFHRTVYVYRCFSGDTGCGSTPIDIAISVDIPWVCNTHDINDYRVFYEGKVSLRNNDKTALYQNGSLFGSYEWAEWSGWSDSDNNANISVNLYTPKKSGNSLQSAYQIRQNPKRLNNWDDDDSKPATLGIFNVDWKTYFDYRSGLGNANGTGYYHVFNNPWGAEREVVSRKYGPQNAIEYGTRKTFTETLNYKSNGVVSGTAKEKVCTQDGKEIYRGVEGFESNTEPNSTDRSRTINVNISNPFNFNTSMSSAINGGSGSTIIGGGTATLRYSADITPKINSNINNYPYYSEVPSGTKVTAVSFLLKPGVDFNTANSRYSNLMKDRTDTSNIPGGNLCRYLASIFGNDMIKEGEANGCYTLINRNSGDINRGLGNAGEKTSNGASAIAGEESKSVTIPDIEDGHKYCTVIGISHTDSGDGFNVSNNWHISNISCRTIAKVPTFQAWGGVYTSGGINTTTVKKIPSADIGTSSGNRSYLFGSWAETLAVANQQIHGFATGAAIGYLGDKLGGFPITNSGSGKINYCNVTNISIANNQCDKKVSGNAGNIVVSNSDFLSKFVSHYTTTGSGLQQVTDSVKYYKANDDVTFNDTGEIARENTSRLRNGVISVNEGTLIFQVDGDVTINHNICTGYISSNGQCTNGVMTGSATLGSENYQYRAGATKIPQVIIIASGNVNISKDVTEIDAWIYSGKTIKTCADGSIGNNTCGNPLIINGPVFAKNIELHRTYGANGTRSWNGPFAAGSNYLSSGAATPAEIFNLRSDVYQWIYQQISTENKTANVRYMRELSPRY